MSITILLLPSGTMKIISAAMLISQIWMMSWLLNLNRGRL